MFLLPDYYDDNRFFTNQDGLWKVSVRWIFTKATME
jgi:hypothetical protein